MIYMFLSNNLSSADINSSNYKQSSGEGGGGLVSIRLARLGYLLPFGCKEYVKFKHVRLILIR